jgi:hypothetical protein
MPVAVFSIPGTGVVVVINSVPIGFFLFWGGPQIDWTVVVEPL